MRGIGIMTLAAVMVTAGVAAAQTAKSGNPVVVIDTSMGAITVELYPDKAPKSVENFLGYMKDKHYDGTIFHRIIPGFMAQGGGFTPDMVQKKTKAPIVNEAKNGLSNDRGTLAMARTNVVDSATSQFFINVADNKQLDHRGEGPAYGYAVFGKVTAGMDVVDKIVAAPRGDKGGFQNVPNTPILINSIKVKP